MKKQKKGCYVVGTAGSDSKISLLKNEFGFNDSINYKTIGDNVSLMKKELRKKFPNGIDLYFDNTGIIFAPLFFFLRNPMFYVCRFA